MHRLRATGLALGLSAVVSSSPQAAFAQWDHWAVRAPADILGNEGLRIYTVDSNTGTSTLRTTKCFPQGGINPCEGMIGTNSYIDGEDGNLVLVDQSGAAHKYNLTANTWKDIGPSWKSVYLMNGTFVKPNVLKDSSGNINVRAAGETIYSQKSDGSVHLGPNSLITNEIADVQQVFAQNAGGDNIPVNFVTSELQINGVGVQSQITTNATNTGTNTTSIGANTTNIGTNTTNIGTNTASINTNSANIQVNTSTITSNTSKINSNTRSIEENTYNINSNSTKINLNSKSILKNKSGIKSLATGVKSATALSAALSGLPTISDDAPLSCGAGGGTYSSSFAIGIGCATNVNSRLAINAGGSFLTGGSTEYEYGNFDSVAGRIGFILKLGNLNDQAQNERVESSYIQPAEQQLLDTIEDQKSIINNLSKRLAKLEKMFYAKTKEQAAP